MAMIGMDVEVVRGIGTRLQAQGQTLDGVVQQIDALINEAIGAWQGTDATQFQEWWTSQHKPALMQASEAIKGLGQSATNNAAAQEQASGS